MYARLVVLLLIITACRPPASAPDDDDAPASGPLNLSFEIGDQPVGWSTGVNGVGPVTPPKDFAVSLDRTVVHDGMRSLRLTGPRQGMVLGIGLTLFHALPLDAVRGKSLRFSGWVRSRSRQGGLFLRVDGPGPRLSTYNVFPVDGGADGEWQQYTVELPIPADARRVIIGCYHRDVGEAWFDGLEVSVGGVPLLERPTI